MTDLTIDQQLAQLDQAIAAQAALRGIMPDETIDVTIKTLQQQKAALQVEQPSTDNRSVGGSDYQASVAAGGDVVGRDKVGQDKVGRDKIAVYAESGATVVVGGEEGVALKNIDRNSVLGKYLRHLIAHNRYLQLQGIRSGGRQAHIELEQIYITLRATQQRTVAAEEAWLLEEAGHAPGERRRFRGLTGENRLVTQTVTVTVNEALHDHRRLVVLGDPGSGKTTLLRYLALIYAQDMAGGSGLVEQKLSLPDRDHLSILLHLRQVGAFLQDQPAETDGHRLLLQFFCQSLHSERIETPIDFFDSYLQSGRAIVLLDGLDEIADPERRRRVSRLLEFFVRAYPDCRFVVTSRIVGYTGAAELGENFKTTTVRDFSLADIRHFLSHWQRLVAVGQLGPGAAAEAMAQNQTDQLLSAIENNNRIRELAINPLMLTVIALVHRDRVKLPDRRAELYAEAVDVLLGKWDEARGIKEETPILEDRPFDAGDKRLLLQSVALTMHETALKEIETADLKRLLYDLFADIVGQGRAAERAAGRFLHVVRERTGLLVARGEGVYAFSHLTFQEYLAALAILAKDDYLAYIQARAHDSWWRETILLVAGRSSMDSKPRTTALIEAIARLPDKEEPYHNLVLAADCLRDAGPTRVIGNIDREIQERLQADLALDIEQEMKKQRFQLAWVKLLHRWRKEGESEESVRQAFVRRKIAAATALGRLGEYTGQGYWRPPHGEPEWVEIPAGEFLMGSRETPTSTNAHVQELYDAEKPQHSLYLPTFLMAKTPVTNAQYRLFVEAAGHRPPYHWEDGQIPRGLDNHPVVYVTWHDALAYCRWLSEATGKAITLPSEAEWEKAARGTDGRLYPWGNEFDSLKANSDSLGLGATTPVGIFPDGASPYGLLDMAGNVFEWTRSLYRAYDAATWEKEKEIVWKSAVYGYPYDSEDGRENLDADDEWTHVVRGGSWYMYSNALRCASRDRHDPVLRLDSCGFRLCVRPHFPPPIDRLSL